jgi:hypothetical protein
VPRAARLSTLPFHIRMRRSTLLLLAAFLLVGALYVVVHPQKPKPVYVQLVPVAPTTTVRPPPTTARRVLATTTTAVTVTPAPPGSTSIGPTTSGVPTTPFAPFGSTTTGSTTTSSSLPHP